MFLEEKARIAFNLKTPWPSSVGSPHQNAKAYSKVIRAGRGRGKDRAGAQQPSSMPTTAVASPARRTTIPGTSQSRRDWISQKGSQGEAYVVAAIAGVVASWLVGGGCRGKVRAEGEAREKKRIRLCGCWVYTNQIGTRRSEDCAIPFQAPLYPYRS